MAADNGQPSYTVSVPPLVRERFRPWLELARRVGLDAEYVADLKLIDRKLLYAPVSWGDPLWDLPNAKLKVFRGMSDLLIVTYAVHFSQPLVLVRDITLRHDRPLGQAEANPPSGEGAMTPPYVGRELCKAIHEFKGGSLYWQLLAPWVDTHPELSAWLTIFAARTGEPIPPATDEELWELYALGRVSQTLLLRFQSGRADGTDWPGPPITLAEYTAFFESLGFVEANTSRFSPFFHEIVQVEQHQDDDAPITLVGEFWPCLMLGDMLFSRAGVRMTGGRSVIDKAVAESSTLYWAHRRKNRPYQDQSHGWGSNSQWRTKFRRDYRIGDVFHFNVGGRREVGGADDDGLIPVERIELLTHRCFVTTTKPHDDLYPYDLRYISPVG